ncbi:MAG: efflux RND transporter permease subunit [Parachlamydiaceae bacterium]|nr:efflux RND transporter permease subunit [Parachlamydiaceae bacterium]
MNLSAPFIRRPVMTTLLMLAIFIAGIIAFKKLPVSDLPNIDYPTISVSAFYSGAAPETMVRLITTPIEKELINVGGVKEICSITSRGSTEITLNFDLDKNLDEATREVQIALNRAESRLPSDMEQKPSYQKQSSNNEPIVYLVLTSQTASVAEMREYGEKYIEPRLSRIEGVAIIETFGSPHAV